MRRRLTPGRFLGGLLLSLFCLALTSCQSLVDKDQTAINRELAPVLLTAGQSVGQTFVARHGGLNGVEFWLEPQPGSRGTLRAHLRAEALASNDLAQATLPLEQVTAPGFYCFSFPQDNHSHGVYRYVFLELEGTGTVLVGTAAGDAYIDGAAYQNHEPLDAQLAFRLTYAPTGAALELGWAVLQGAGLLLVAALLYLVPGYALLAWLWSGEPLPWPVRMGLAAGLSLALYPLLLLWTDLVGLHLGALYAWLPAVGGLLALVWRYRQWRPRQGWGAIQQWARSEAFWPDLTLVVVLALVFGVRLLVVRTLDAPLWGDSYQHAVIAQLLVDHGGLFDSWEPYTPYQGLTVHYGFPTFVALLSWSTGIATAKATLLVGQLVNGLAVLAIYPLAMRLAEGRRWAGVGAVLAAGLASPMPAFYVNWGRYAQLAGQAILPVALWLLWDVAEQRAGIKRRAGLAGLTLAGMTLCYYRMPLYYAPFVAVWLVVWGGLHWGKVLRPWWVGLTRLALVALVGIGLVLPWSSYVMGGKLATAVSAGVSYQSPLARVVADYQVWKQITTFVPWPLLGSAALGLGLALIRRRWLISIVGLWTLLLALWVLGWLVGFPGANMMQNFAILIALYIPVGLAAGWLTGAAADWLGHRVAAIVCVILALWSARGLVRIVDSDYIMVTRPDMRAMAWIQEHIPADARFLVEGFRIYEGRSVVGSDAGWWIPLLTRRENTMPPQYALLNEVPVEAGYSRQVVDLVAHLETHRPSSPAGIQRLCELSITHVYIGQGAGKIGAGAVQLFDAADLIGSAFFQPVYHENRVWIFALIPQTCEKFAP